MKDNAELCGKILPNITKRMEIGEWRNKESLCIEQVFSLSVVTRECGVSEWKVKKEPHPKGVSQA